MLSPADRIIEATMPHTLRPKRGNREKVIAATLEFLIEEYGYDAEFGMIGTIRNDVIDVKDLQKLIAELRDTETPDELAQGNTKTDLDTL